MYYCPHCNFVGDTQSELDGHCELVHPGGTNPSAPYEGVTLEEIKNLRLADVQNRTEEILTYGIIYDTTRLSLSAKNRIYYNWLYNHIDGMTISYPMSIQGYDLATYYNFANAADYKTFCLQGAQYIYDCYMAENVIEAQILAATTISEVLAVEDNR